MSDKNRRREERRINGELIRAKDREYYARNRDRKREYRRVNADWIKERDRRYYEKNKKEILERGRKYRRENIEKIRESKRKYYREHRDRILEQNRLDRRRRRAERRRERAEQKRIERERQEWLRRVGYKDCLRCGQILELGEFAKSKTSWDGYINICKECNRERFRENWTSRLKERRERECPGYKVCRRCDRLLPVEEFNKSWRGSDGLQTQCRECSKEHSREWREAHSERQRQLIREASKRWRELHPEQAREKNIRNQAIRRAAVVVEFDMALWLETQKPFRCYLCGRLIGEGEPYHIDHRVPLSRGGKHASWNVNIAHADCNLRKGAKKLFEYLPARFRPELDL